MKNTLKNASKMLGVCALGLSIQSNMFAATPAQPNVVFMLADNLGWGDVSANNLGTRGDFQTPNIDELFGDGVNMTQFLVEPGCTPSRAGLMTGRYSIRSGLSSVILPGTPNTLSPNEYTLGHLFKDAGYNTMYTGKWHLDAEVPSQPQNVGFDEWRVGFTGTTDATLYSKTSSMYKLPQEMQDAIADSNYILEAVGPGDPVKIRRYDDEYRLDVEEDITNATVKYIFDNAEKGEPFFVAVGFTRPHFPNEVREEWQGISGIGKYGDSVMELDHRVGQIHQAVKDAGIEDNTIIVFVSDNGPTTTATVENEKYRGSAGPFRGELGDPTEGSIRTVGGMKWKGVIPEGSRTNEMFSIHDFLPTFAGILGREIPTDLPIDGVDQTSFLHNIEGESNRENLLTFIADRLVAVRYRQFRMYPVETMSSGQVGGLTSNLIQTAVFPQIYNIEVDPYERLNIANENGYLVPVYNNIIRDFEHSLIGAPNPDQLNMTDLRYAEDYVK